MKQESYLLPMIPQQPNNVKYKSYYQLMAEYLWNLHLGVTRNIMIENRV